MRWRDLTTAVIGAIVGAALSGCWWLVDAAPRSVTARSGEWRDAVVQVRADRCDGGEVRGTGVVVDGRVLTNVHVVSGASEVVVVTRGGHRLPVRSVAVSTRVDLAALAVQGADVGEGLELGPGTGDLVLAGFPAGGDYVEEPVEVDGTTGADRFPDPHRAWRLDRTVVGGQSGSPVVDDAGRLAALLYGRAVEGGNGLAITSADLRAELATLVPKHTAC